MLVFVNGCFDLLHIGHIRLLEFANEYGNVFVGLNSDNSVRYLKGLHRPVFDQNIRKEVLLSIKYVYDVVIFNEPTPENIINVLNPNIIIVGYDHSINDQCYHSSLRASRKLIQAPKFSDYSTSDIIRKINV